MSKTRTTLIGTTLIAAIALGVPATSASAKGGAGLIGGAAALAFEDFDQNGDGNLTKEELRDLRRAHFNAADSNGDGELSAEEMQAAADTRRAERFARMVERMDTDGNGAVSAEEMEAAHDSMQDRRGKGRDHAEQQGGKRWHGKGDDRRADRGDMRHGKMGGDRHERRAGRGDAMFEQMFALADSDGNGTLSKEEFDSAKARLTEARAAHRAAPETPEAPQDN